MINKKKGLVKIEENLSLARDTSTNAIINTNKNAVEEAKAAKAKRLKQLALDERVNSLEQKLDKILELLTDNK